MAKTETKPVTRVGMSEGDVVSPEGLRPWEERALLPQDRYESYLLVARAHISQIVAASKRDGITEEERTALRLSPDTQFWKGELEQLRKETPEEFCERLDGGAVRELLGKNFLGAASWKVGFGVDVGVVPPIPKEVTQSLLESPCPLHPGQKIKDTHILMLVPKTVNGEAYTALKLDELCASRKGSGDRLIDPDFISWKTQSWANAPQAQSEWVLLPKSDPDPNVSPEKHFRSKDITAQQKVHEAHYSEYREGKVLEVMTMALLNDVVNGEPRILDGWNYLRCIEPNASGGRVCVGFFDSDGLQVGGDGGDGVSDDIGCALARKLKT